MSARPILVNTFLVHLTLRTPLLASRFLKHWSANKRPTRSESFIPFHFQIVDLSIRVWFGVVTSVAVDLLLGTSFIHRYVQEKFPSERKLVPWHSRPVDILPQSLMTSNTVLFVDHEYATALAKETRRNVEAALPVTLAPCSHKIVMVTSSFSGHLIIKSRNLRASRAFL